MCSENKGTDQIRGYRDADLRLCFRICKKLVFSRRGSIYFWLYFQTHKCAPLNFCTCELCFWADSVHVFGHCVFYGVESWSGVLEWSHRVESWRQMLERIARLKLKQSQSIFYNIARHFRCGCKFIYYHLDIFLGQPQT